MSLILIFLTGRGSKIKFCNHGKNSSAAAENHGNGQALSNGLRSIHNLWDRQQFQAHRSF